ncbi:MAG: CpsD/CapB family tyrosine-protein kinase [Gammaproteobacteria bacterium]
MSKEPIVNIKPAGVPGAATQQPLESAPTRAAPQRFTFDVDDDHLRRNHVFIEGTDEESKIAISAYKSLRTHMLREMEQRNVRSMVVTGTTAGVGKSVTAANLAINIARHQQKHVLLVDLDLRSPTVAKLFGFQPTTGIDSVVEPRFVFPKAIVYPDIQHLSILPCVRGHQDSAEILLSKQMSALLQILHNYKDTHIVIFDSPPILGCDDIAAIAPIIDMCLVVVSEGESSRRELKTAMRILGDAPVAGVLLNKSSQNFFKRYYY